MSAQVFYRKWRPQTLAEVVGQEHVTLTLLQALLTSRVAHAYLFSGPRGTGKTSTGRILAKAVNCLNNGKGEPCNQCAMCQAITQGASMDVIEVDAASNRGIDEIRSLREKVAFVPGASRYKVYIIDEVHMLTEPAANALLKTLEEPPAHVIFILATTEPHKLPATILSRCQRFDFHRLSTAAMAARLGLICQAEGINAPAEALSLIARSATGSLRDAQNLLEQMVAYYGPKLELPPVKEFLGLGSSQQAHHLARYILEKDLPAGLAAIHQASSEGVDLRQFLREVINYLREFLLLKVGSEEAVEATAEDKAERKALAEKVPLDGLLQAVRLFSQIDLRLDNYNTLPLEMALVESSLPAQEASPASPPRSRPATTAAPSYTPPQTTLPTSHLPPPIPSPPRPAPVPAPRAAEPTPAPLAPPPAGIPALDYLRQHWREFVNSLRGEGSTGTLDALLRNSCKPVSLDGDTLTLGFYWELHKSKIEDPKYCFLIERKLSQFFGVPYKLRCILTPKTSGHLVDAALKEGARIIPEEVK